MRVVPVIIMARRNSLLPAVQQAGQSGFATGGQRPGPGPADHHAVGTQRERAEHIHAAADTAIHQNLSLPADRRDNVGQFAGRCGDAIELTAAVVGHYDAIRTAGDGVAGISASRMPFSSSLPRHWPRSQVMSSQVTVGRTGHPPRL